MTKIIVRGDILTENQLFDIILKAVEEGQKQNKKGIFGLSTIDMLSMKKQIEDEIKAERACITITSHCSADDHDSEKTETYEFFVKPELRSHVLAIVNEATNALHLCKTLVECGILETNDVYL